ncbi:hypothetical protein ACNOYE_25050 [Nannocystaceae bacterium ST9]
MLTRLAPARFAAAAGLFALLAGCRIEDAPEQPIADHVALCCKANAGSPLRFTGCRPSNRCRTSETLWLRGPVACGPVDAERCEGGRCCALEVQTPTPPEPAIVGAPIEAPREPPAPARIEPMPFESP